MLAKYGNREHQRAWLLPLLHGSIRSCFAMTEKAVASSDATNITASIARSPCGRSYTVDGVKWWISGAMDPRCKVGSSAKYYTVPDNDVRDGSCKPARALVGDAEVCVAPSNAVLLSCAAERGLGPHSCAQRPLVCVPCCVAMFSPLCTPCSFSPSAVCFQIAIFMGKTDPSAPPHKQQSMILVPMDTPGVRVRRCAVR